MKLLWYFSLFTVYFTTGTFAQMTDSNTVDPVSFNSPKPTGFDTISGPLPKILKKGERPYYVIADIEVPTDQTVTIEAGAVLLFKDFSGLHVQGRLIALGTRNEPVVFTSEFDTIYTKNNDFIPNPFDWNGIYIHAGGIGSSLEYCTVLYSVYGIKSDSKYIRINETTFKDNGKNDLSIEGKQYDTGNGPFSYILTMKDAATDGVPVNILRDPLAPRRNTVRYVGLAAAGGGFGIAAYYAQKTWKTQHELSRLSSNSVDIIRKYSTMDWSQTKKIRNKYLLYSITGGIAGILGTIGFVWTFTF